MKIFKSMLLMAFLAFAIGSFGFGVAPENDVGPGIAIVYHNADVCKTVASIDQIATAEQELPPVYASAMAGVMKEFSLKIDRERLDGANIYASPKTGPVHWLTWQHYSQACRHSE